jgi:phosphate transport system substrate-binding protein
MRRITPRTRRRALQLAPLVVVATLVGIAVGEAGGGGDRKGRPRDKLAGTVTIDGTPAMRGMLDRAAQRFQRRHPGVRVTVGASGDANAIALFCTGEVDFAAAARHLDKSEQRACGTSGTRYSEFEVAREPIALVVSERNEFARHLSIDQARTIWRPLDAAVSWAQIDPAFPQVPLEPTGWKPDSAPATLLAEALFGADDPVLRADYAVAGDAKELTAVTASSANSIGFLPERDLGPGSGVRTVRVLPRPLYLDVSANSASKPEARRFLREYLASHRLYRKFTRP